MGIIENQKYLVWTCTLLGVKAYPAVVSATETSERVPIDFLSEVASKEALLRVRSALENSGDKPMYGKPSAYAITVGQAETRQGPLTQIGLGRSALHLDLPLAVATLASRGIPTPGKYAFAGELSLGGEVRQFRGAAPMARALKASGAKLFVVPVDAVAEVEATGMAAYGVRTLTDVYHLLLDPPNVTSEPTPLASLPSYSIDFNDCKVAPDSQWPLAVEVALAGNHSLLLEGLPGCGKTMVARRMPTCLEMDEETRKQATDIYSVTGLLNDPQRVAPAFRAPHHTISEVGIMGSTPGTTRPGEATLAHGGVLFLDEAPEFRRQILERLRMVYQQKKSDIWQKGINTVTYPADFMLVAAMGPCPCGARGAGICDCTTEQILRYQGRVDSFGFDIKVRVVAAGKDDPRCENSKTIRTRVMKARALQLERQGCLNGDRPYPRGSEPAVAKLMAIAQTLADLDQPDGPADAKGNMTMEHIQIAMELVNE